MVKEMIIFGSDLTPLKVSNIILQCHKQNLVCVQNQNNAQGKIVSVKQGSQTRGTSVMFVQPGPRQK